MIYKAKTSVGGDCPAKTGVSVPGKVRRSWADVTTVSLLTTLFKVYGLWPGPSWILKERFAPTWKSLLDDANWHTVTKLVARGLNPHLGSFYMSTPCATVQSYPDKEEEKINPSFCDG